MLHRSMHRMDQSSLLDCQPTFRIIGTKIRYRLRFSLPRLGQLLVSLTIHAGPGDLG